MKGVLNGHDHRADDSGHDGCQQQTEHVIAEPG